MPSPFTFELVSPEKLLFSGEIEMVTIPGAEGDFGVLAHHAPLIALLRAGEIRLWRNGQVSERMQITGGFAEVAENKCTVLADG